MLKDKGVSARVVSLPSWQLFDAQPLGYRRSVLPPQIRARLSIEAAATIGWERYVGLDGKVIGLERFGTSAPGKIILKRLGFSIENIVKEALELLKRDE